ncbi:MAG TPA: HD domain-containing protein [Prolixibacteraceae bacterium]|nr:HD domain-containing protein [Prolixibacteraceae bacterium]
MKKVLEAALFAAGKHRNQKRKGVDGTPYINHPLEVAYLLNAVGGITDEDILSAAILHDTVEDTGTSPEELVSRFGEEVARYVLEVSDDKQLPKEERKRLQVEHAPHLSYGARLIKLGDRIANLRSVVSEPPAGWPVERQIRYFEWSRAVFKGLGPTNPPLEELFLREFDEGFRIVSARGGSSAVL